MLQALVHASRWHQFIWNIAVTLCFCKSVIKLSTAMQTCLPLVYSTGVGNIYIHHIARPLTIAVLGCIKPEICTKYCVFAAQPSQVPNTCHTGRFWGRNCPQVATNLRKTCPLSQTLPKSLAHFLLYSSPPVCYTDDGNIGNPEITAMYLQGSLALLQLESKQKHLRRMKFIDYKITSQKCSICL